MPRALRFVLTPKRACPSERRSEQSLFNPFLVEPIQARRQPRCLRSTSPILREGRAVRMRQMRPRVRIIRLGLKPRLRAPHRPPSRSILRHLTHLRASRMRPGLIAMAIATGLRAGLHPPRRICHKGRNPPHQTNQDCSRAPRWRDPPCPTMRHTPSFRASLPKTYSARSLAVLLPGSWNHEGRSCRNKSRRDSRK